MLLKNARFAVSQNDAAPSSVLSIRLSDEMVQALLRRPNSVQIAFGDSEASKHTLFIDGQQFIVNGSREAQAVDVVQADLKNRSLTVFGTVVQKLTAQQELAQDKASAIRQQTEQAEKERHARKYIFVLYAARTMTIDTAPKNAEFQGRNLATSARTRSRLMQRTMPDGSRRAVADMVEKASSQSWSPPWQDAASNNAKAKEFLQQRDQTAARKRPSTACKQLAPQPRSEMELKHDQLARQFHEKYEEYDKIESWLDGRLAIFVQLRKDLEVAQNNPSALERVATRIENEYGRLKADKEFKWKSAEAAALRVQAEQLKSSIETLIKQP